jgi:hypothetical protein
MEESLNQFEPQFPVTLVFLLNNGTIRKRIYDNWVDLNEHCEWLPKHRYIEKKFFDALGRELHVTHYDDGRLEMVFV